MNISSILITIVGIIIIIALYLMSRIAQSKLPQEHNTRLPDLKDKNGNRFSSIQDDISATDGSTPKQKSSNITPLKRAPATKKIDTNDNNQQIILFISAKEGSYLDGNSIQKSLTDNDLVLGENDIYHYFVEVFQNDGRALPPGKSSLFRVANGIDPWTLKQKDLLNSQLAGLSLVMLLPTKIDDRKGFKIFIRIAQKLSKEINGTLKNQQQQELTQDHIDSLIPR
ncbi:MAG: cell division protein ZipA C-terminal FtsZ-binding domain-containing protein [Cocleimonas sp.]